VFCFPKEENLSSACLRHSECVSDGQDWEQAGKSSGYVSLRRCLINVTGI